jgi:hypothetical protein
LIKIIEIFYKPYNIYSWKQYEIILYMPKLKPQVWTPKFGTFLLYMYSNHMAYYGAYIANVFAIHGYDIEPLKYGWWMDLHVF